MRPVPAWKHIYYAQPYNAPRHRRPNISRAEDWRNWRDVVYPVLEEMGFAPVRLLSVKIVHVAAVNATTVPPHWMRRNEGRPRARPHGPFDEPPAPGASRGTRFTSGAPAFALPVTFPPTGAIRSPAAGKSWGPGVSGSPLPHHLTSSQLA